MKDSDPSRPKPTLGATLEARHDASVSIDRDAILARRAALISTALAALHCSPAPAPSPSDVVNVTPTTSASNPPATATARNPPVAPLTTWDTAISDGPPRAVSTKLPEADRALLESLNQMLKPADEAVRALWEVDASVCANATPDCRTVWEDLGKKAKAAHDALRSLGPGLCGSWGDNPPSFGTLRANHVAYLSKLLLAADERIGKIAAGVSVFDEQEWRRMAANASLTPPMPCLSCRGPDVYPVSNTIKFADGASEVVSLEATRLAAIADQLKAQTTKIRVRGHADPTEAEPDKIALARAKEVEKRLRQAGIDPKRIEVISLGADLPIYARAEGESNRRVEFEIVKK